MKWLDFLFFAKNRGSKYGKKIMNTSTQQAARPGAKKLEEKKFTWSILEYFVSNADTTTQVTAGCDIVFIFKNCAPFTEHITEINDAQIDHPKHVLMSIYKSQVYSETCQTSKMERFVKIVNHI